MDQIKIGKYISECRKEKKLTQEEFAEKIGVSNRSVSRWENGRNMPDLSLYEPICEELGISINELLSGEKINKEDYQQKFEKNVIDVVNNVEIKNRKNNMFLNVLVIFITLICVWFISYIFYCNIQFVEKYDSKNMVIEKSNESKNIIFKTNKCGSFKYIITNKKDLGIIFVTFSQTLEEKNITSKELKRSSIDLTNNKDITHTINLNNSNIKDNYKVYYTDKSFSKITRANDNELDEIIRDSTLIYEK